MTPKLWIAALALCVVAAVFNVQSRLRAQDEPADGEVALEVDGHKITYKDLFEQFSFLYPNEVTDAMETLVLQVAIEDRARKAGIEVSDDQIAVRAAHFTERMIDAMKEHPQFKDLTLEQFLGVQGQTLEQFQADLNFKVREQLQAEFLLAPDLLRSDRMKLWTIKCAKRESIDLVAAKLAEGADFELLAEQYSDDSATRSTGGSLGAVTKDLLAFADYDPPYADFVRAATGDAVSDIIPLPGGFGIYRITGFRAAQTLSPEEEAVQARVMIDAMEITDNEINLFLTKVRRSLQITPHYDHD